MLASTTGNNQTLSPLSNFTAGLHQNSTKENSTNFSLSVKDSNATNQAQKQELISSYIQQHQPSSIQSQPNQQIPLYPPLTQQQLQQQQQPLNQSQPQSYTNTPFLIQQQPFAGLQQQPSQPYQPPMQQQRSLQQQPQQNQQLAQSYPPPPTQQESIPLPEFVPKPGENMKSNDQLSMMVQLQPHETGLEGYYQVSGWQFAISNPSSLCPLQNCVFQLEGGIMGQEWSPGERTLTGKLKIDSGGTTKIRDFAANWAAVEQRQEGGQIVYVIEGTLTTGTDRLGTENRYQINGTLTSYGQDLILAIQGSK
ncbi:hypothetical protein BH18THE2_BH18THE2_30380 [soil metagenome]